MAASPWMAFKAPSYVGTDLHHQDHAPFTVAGEVALSIFSAQPSDLTLVLGMPSGDLMKIAIMSSDSGLVIEGELRLEGSVPLAPALSIVDLEDGVDPVLSKVFLDTLRTANNTMYGLMTGELKFEMQFDQDALNALPPATHLEIGNVAGSFPMFARMCMAEVLGSLANISRRLQSPDSSRPAVIPADVSPIIAEFADDDRSGNSVSPPAALG